MSWFRLLPKALIEVAYVSSGEFAWSRNDALSVLAELQKHKYVILGVDVWIPTNPGPTIPTPYVYDWDSEGGATRNDRERTARNFILNFEWSPDDRSHFGLEPYFNITAVSERPQ